VCGLASIRILLKDGKLLHRVYVVTPVGSTSMVYEYERDGKTGNWTKLSSVIGPVLTWTRLAVQGWNTTKGPELYLYCQDGADGTKVTEWNKLGSAPWAMGPRFP
jgi:Fungal fucose-specific lectin